MPPATIRIEVVVKMQFPDRNNPYKIADVPNSAHHTAPASSQVPRRSRRGDAYNEYTLVDSRQASVATAAARALVLLETRSRSVPRNKLRLV
jgi:hypothetical protein